MVPRRKEGQEREGERERLEREGVRVVVEVPRDVEDAPEEAGVGGKRNRKEREREREIERKREREGERKRESQRARDSHRGEERWGNLEVHEDAELEVGERRSVSERDGASCDSSWFLRSPCPATRAGGGRVRRKEGQEREGERERD